MFKKRENLIGIILLLGFCLVVIWTMLRSIIDGDQLTYNGPDWLPPILMVAFFGISIYMAYVAFFRDRGQRNQWPNPGAGRRSLWDRIRGKGE